MIGVLFNSDASQLAASDGTTTPTLVGHSTARVHRLFAMQTDHAKLTL